MDDVSTRIQHLLGQLAISQAKLGALAGVSKQAVSRWVNGTSEPERDALLNLQRRRQINPLWITDGSPPMQFGGVHETPAGYQSDPLRGLTRRQRDQILELIEEMRQQNREVVAEVGKLYSK